jgi:hypothetical protein
MRLWRNKIINDITKNQLQIVDFLLENYANGDIITLSSGGFGMYSYEVTEGRVFDLIESKDRNDNHLFTDVSNETMERVVNYLSSPSAIDNGYVLVDIDEKEIRHIENMINKSLNMYDSHKLFEVQSELANAQRKLSEADSAMSSNLSSSDVKESLRNSISNLENAMKKIEKDDTLTKFFLTSGIVEEYIYGKIMRELAKRPELVTKYGFKDLDAKLKYFDEFMQMNGIAPNDYGTFNDNRFCQLMDLTLLTRERDMELTVGFTNFQNVCNPLTNRVINSITSFNSKILRTMIFTSGEGLLTRMVRDEGQITKPEDYRQHTLSKSMRLALTR